MGWDSQLNNEPVFKVSYGRTYRSWVNDDDSSDIITRFEGGLGNLESNAYSSISFRYGENLTETYASMGFSDSRLSNPVAVEGSWYVFGGLTSKYTFHSIHLDGNTFEDSQSVEYDRFSIGLIVGIAYSWDNISLTFSIADSDIIVGSLAEAKDKDQYSRYGSLTVGWKI